MDVISNNIDGARHTLSLSRQQIESLNVETQAALVFEITSTTKSLNNAEVLIHHIVEQSGSYLGLIKGNPDNLTNLDIDPQLQWLHDSLGDVVACLEEAHAATLRALQKTMQANYRVLEIRQTTVSQSDRLSEYRNELTQISNAAAGTLPTIGRRLGALRLQISTKNCEAARANADLVSKQLEYQQAQSRVVKAQERADDLERHQLQYRERDVTAGKALCALGLLAAPFTFGGSLVLSGVGAALAMSGSTSANEIREEIATLRTDEVLLNSKVMYLGAQVESIEREKRDLEVSALRDQSELHQQMAIQRQCNSQVTEASRLQTEITTIQSQAESVLEHVVEARAGLLKIKKAVEQVSVVIKKNSLQVSASESVVKSLLRTAICLVASEKRRRRKFDEGKSIMKGVGASLRRVQSKMPRLLAPVQQVGLGLGCGERVIGAEDVEGKQSMPLALLPRAMPGIRG